MKSFLVLDRNQSKIFYKFCENDIQRNFYLFRDYHFPFLEELRQHISGVFKESVECVEQNTYIDQ